MVQPSQERLRLGLTGINDLLSAASSFTNMIDCFLSMFEDSNDPTQDQYDAFVKTLPENTPGDKFVRTSDEGHEAIAYLVYDLTNSLRETQSAEMPDINAMTSLKNKLAFVQAFLNEYLAFGINLDPETRSFTVLLCRDLRVYKRYD